jgi:hypothetical protein
LRETHTAVVQTLVRDLDAAGLFLDLLSDHDFLHALRTSLEPMTSPAWRALLPGDPLPRRAWGRRRDLSELWYPRIGYQLLETPFERPLPDGVVQAGERWLSSVYMEFGPQDLRAFAALFAELDRALPVRIAFQLDGGFSHWRLRRVLADFWAFAGEYNRRISEAFTDLDVTRRTQPTPRLRVCATTWGPDETSALARVARLRAALAGADVPAASRGTGACPDVLAALSRHLEGDLTAGKCAELDAHVQECAACRGACESLREVLALCRSAEAPALPVEARARLREALGASSRRVTATRATRA